MLLLRAFWNPLSLSVQCFFLYEGKIFSLILRRTGFMAISADAQLTVGARKQRAVGDQILI